MPRYGVRTLLRYRIHSQSHYILINRSTYCHPYNTYYTDYNDLRTDFDLGNVRYRIIKHNDYNDITYRANGFMLYFNHNRQITITFCYLFQIVVYVGEESNCYNIYTLGGKFLTQTEELKPYISTLNPTTVYDLYRQSISWLLPFAINRCQITD